MGKHKQMGRENIGKRNVTRLRLISSLGLYMIDHINIYIYIYIYIYVYIYIYMYVYI